MGVCWVISQNEMSKQKMTEILLSILKDKSDYNKKKSNLKKLNYQNTWNDVNQNLKNIINEN
jgi:UDP-N-acetylglucosamine--N-acetylmuramyl-(pentapeptide) pyrophosphoryl-undecaprenol N-acetylglucosamine transferase